MCMAVVAGTYLFANTQSGFKFFCFVLLAVLSIFAFLKLI